MDSKLGLSLEEKKSQECSSCELSVIILMKGKDHLSNVSFPSYLEYLEISSLDEGSPSYLQF